MKNISEYALFETDEGDIVLAVFDEEHFQQIEQPAKITCTMPLTIELINRTFLLENFDDQQLGSLLHAASMNKADMMRINPQDDVAYEAVPLVIGD